MLELVRSIQSNKVAHIADPGERQKLCEYLVSEAISISLELPSSFVEHPKMFFNERHMDAVCRKIAKANEQMVLDFDQILELVYGLWYTRYLLVFEPTNRRVNNLVRLAVVDNGSMVPGKYREVLEKHETIKIKSWDVKGDEGVTNE